MAVKVKIKKRKMVRMMLDRDTTSKLNRLARNSNLTVEDWITKMVEQTTLEEPTTTITIEVPNWAVDRCKFVDKDKWKNSLVSAICDYADTLPMYADDGEEDD